MQGDEIVTLIAIAFTGIIAAVIWLALLSKRANSRYTGDDYRRALEEREARRNRAFSTSRKDR